MIEQDNGRILALLSAYLNERPRAVEPATLRELIDECGLDAEEAYLLALAGAMGLDIADDRADRDLFERYLRGWVRRLDPAVYTADPYFSRVRVPEKRLGRWELRRQAFAPCELIVCGDMTRSPDGRIHARLGWFGEEFAYPAVLEGGREWMLITPNEIETMRPAVAKARGRVLAFGLGLGYFPFMVLEKTEVSSVTVVERDPDVLSLFQEELLPQFPHKEKISLVHADAFDFARERLPGGGWDFVFTDLWHDAGDGLPLYLRMKALEPLAQGGEFAYWIEPTLRCYL